MRTFRHYNARSIDEALSLLGEHREGARLNAGGTDLLGLLKDMSLPRYPDLLVNIKTIPGLDYIEEDPERLRIGALTKLNDLARSQMLREKYGAISEAARAVAGPQLRNIATIGGNLCQDVRCWYYRYPAHLGGTMDCARKGRGPCFALKGDNRYHAVTGAKKCFAVCPSDLATALAALDGRMTIVSRRGERRVAVEDFFSPLRNALEADEIVREIDVPVASASRIQTFLKFTLREPIDFAIVSVACAIEFKEGICSDARIIIGAVAPGPFRARQAEEALTGREISEAAATKAAELVLQGAKPLSKNAYKIQIAKTLVKRAIQKIGEMNPAPGKGQEKPA
jgi:xanthine dehydrogenase YagS FAD-binding subunit